MQYSYTAIHHHFKSPARVERGQIDHLTGIRLLQSGDVPAAQAYNRPQITVPLTTGRLRLAALISISVALATCPSALRRSAGVE